MADLVSAFRQQAVACGRLGSPMYEALLESLTAHLGTGGPLDRVLAGHEDDPGPSGLALRLLGTVHRLVLEGRAAELARYYPSVGGRFDLEAALPVLLSLLDDERDAVAEGLERPPQTNEVGRGAALVGALLRLSPPGLPVRLVELGASAGLNLRADHFRCSGVGGAWGPPDSPVSLQDVWQGVPTPVDRQLQVVERVGCDPSPIDPTSTQGQVLLTAYVWPDQQARLERLRGAFEVAARVPVEMHRRGAAEMVAGLQVQPGRCTVLWHSVMWQYVDPAERALATTHVERLGAQSSADAPFLHLYLEPLRRSPGAPHEFVVAAQQWPPGPAGTDPVLGTTFGHGVPVTWER